MTKTYHFIHEQDALDEWCQQQIDTTSLLALDTEFMRVKTYFPKLCLVQLATITDVVCIDPLAIQDFSTLIQLLTAEHITKILHSASQDLETLIHTFNVLPSPIYDTQIALSVLGSDHLMSYQDTISTYLAITLDKSQTRTNWSKRPLTEQQIQYAYDDVDYLIEAYLHIDGLIETQHKRTALDAALIPLTEGARYRPNPLNAWKKVKRKNTLRGKRLKLLKVLAYVREQLAIQKNLPKRWVIEDELLIHLSKHYSQPCANLAQDTQLIAINKHIGQLLIEAIKKFWCETLHDNDPCTDNAPLRGLDE